MMPKYEEKPCVWQPPPFLITSNVGPVVADTSAQGAPERVFRSDESIYFDNRFSMQTITRTVNDFLVHEFSRIPEVSYIYSEQDGDVFYATIVVSEHDDDVLDRVFEFQQNIITEFKNLSLDFSVLFQDGRHIDEIISPSTPLYSRT